MAATVPSRAARMIGRVAERQMDHSSDVKFNIQWRGKWFFLDWATISSFSDREAALRHMDGMRMVYPLHEFRLVWARRAKEKPRLAG